MIRGLIEISYCYKKKDYSAADCLTYDSSIKKGFGFAVCGIVALFVMFCTIMLIDQIQMKYKETSTIDKM